MTVDWDRLAFYTEKARRVATSQWANAYCHESSTATNLGSSIEDEQEQVVKPDEQWPTKRKTQMEDRNGSELCSNGQSRSKTELLPSTGVFGSGEYVRATWQNITS